MQSETKSSTNLQNILLDCQHFILDFDQQAVSCDLDDLENAE